MMTSVGLCVWRQQDAPGRDVVFEPGEVVHIPPRVLSVVVQVIGGILPQWVAPSNIKDERCDAEFIIIRDASTCHGIGNVPLHGLQAFSPKTRVTLSSASMDAAPDGSKGLPWTDLHIKARGSDLDLVGEALAAVFSGNLLIGVDWADLLLTAGAVCPSSGFGSATLAEGIYEAASVPLLHTAAANSNGGLLLVQLVSHADEGKFSLEAYDAFAAQVLAQVDNRSCLVTATLGASCSILALFAFRSRAQRDESITFF